MSEGLIWAGILLCISQSAMLSGSNLAFYRLSRLRLEAESRRDPRALRVLALRRDSNFLLATILWGNVAINVLLALLANSVLVGVLAFLFSTVIITWFGEIMPQAYFSRHPLRMAAALSPVIRAYQFLLYPVARPTGRFLDWWLGREAIEYLHEPLLRDILKAHLRRDDTEVSEVEGIGALNFLDIDDLTTVEAGEDVAPESIVEVPVTAGRPLFPAIEPRADDPFLQAVNQTLHTWAILVDAGGEPLLALNVSEFTRAALYGDRPFDPYRYCHRPIVVRDHTTTLGDVIGRLKRRRVAEGAPPDAVIENDVVLIWLDRRRIITGSDILGRLLTGIGSSRYA
jgi:metal transporter CNNM